MMGHIYENEDKVTIAASASIILVNVGHIL